jgi:SNF family Na+-dependent transporter
LAFPLFSLFLWVKLALKNRGGVFFIPFILFLLILAIPLFTLEAMMGQLFKKGPVEFFSMIRAKFTGIGWATVFISWVISLYYAVILCWSVYYFFLSFQNPLPWSEEASLIQNSNMTIADIERIDYDKEAKFMNVEFFKQQVLKVSEGIENMGRIDGGLMLCLVVTYVIIFLCIAKGIQSSSKVVYFTAPAPIVLLVVLMVK